MKIHSENKDVSKHITKLNSTFKLILKTNIVPNLESVQVHHC